MLKYKDYDSVLDTVSITVVRLVLTVGMCLMALYLAMASTMGPAIAPDTWIAGVQLDMIIRLGMLLAALGLSLFAIVWFIYPLLRYLHKKSKSY